MANCSLQTNYKLQFTAWLQTVANQLKHLNKLRLCKAQFAKVWINDIISESSQ